MAQDSQDEVSIEWLTTLGRGIIRDVAWSRDGETVAAISSTGVWLYDPDFPEAPRLLSGDVRGGERAVFTSDGNALVVVENDGDVWRWNVSDFSEMPTLYATGISIGILGGVVALGSDGQTLATVSYSSQDRDHLIRLIHLQSDVMTVRTLIEHTDRVLDLAFNSDSTRLASIGMDGTLIVWDTITGAERYSVQIFEGNVQTYEVRRVTFSPDGRWLLVNYYPSGLVLDAETGEIVYQDAFETGDSLTFSPDGERLLSVRRNRRENTQATIYQFSPQTGEVADLTGAVVYRETLNAEIRAAFSPDHTRLAIGGVGDVQFMNEAEIGNWMPYNTAPIRIALSADGSELVALGADNRVRLINIEAGEEQLLPLENICDATFAENDAELVLLARDGTLFRWNLGTWTLDVRLSTVIEEVCGSFMGFYGVVFTRETDFTNDGSMLAALADDGIIYLFDTMTGEELARLERSEYRFSDRYFDILKFSTDDLWLVTAGAGIDSSYILILLWNIEAALQRGQLVSDEAVDWLGEPLGPSGYDVYNAVNGVTLNPYGSEASLYSCHACILHWVRTLDDVMVPVFVGSAVGSGAEEVTYSPDGRLFAVGAIPFAPVEGWLLVYDAQSNEEIFRSFTRFEGHPSSIQFSADGSTLAVATEDGLIHIYRINPATS